MNLVDPRKCKGGERDYGCNGGNLVSRKKMCHCLFPMRSDEDAICCHREISCRARVLAQSANIKMKLGHFSSSSTLAQARAVGVVSGSACADV
jgi:hypothetical protein